MVMPLGRFTTWAGRFPAATSERRFVRQAGWCELRLGRFSAGICWT